MRIFIVTITLLNEKRQILNVDFEFYIEKLLNLLYDKINCLVFLTQDPLKLLLL